IIPVRESTKNIPSARRVLDVWDRFIYQDPDSAPFTLITAGNPDSRSAINPEFAWFEKTLFPVFDQINNGAGYSSSATSLVVDDGAYFFAGDVVEVVRTGEKFLVISVSSNTLT